MCSICDIEVQNDPEAFDIEKTMCVCGHGSPWHDEDDTRCTICECKAWESREVSRSCCPHGIDLSETDCGVCSQRT